MAETDIITLFHMPRTRSFSVLTLLEELGVPYGLQVLDRQTGEHRKPEYLATNPMGKVPAILHRGAIVTEQVAIFLYLADLFPEAGLAPPLGSALRGSYLRWMVFHAACYEPALVDRAMKREPAATAMSPYGDFETMLATITDRLAAEPYLLGQSPSAADILWGNALNWGTAFGLVPNTPPVEAYVKRLKERPAAIQAAEIDARLAASQGQQPTKE